MQVLVYSFIRVYGAPSSTSSGDDGTLLPYSFSTPPSIGILGLPPGLLGGYFFGFLLFYSPLRCLDSHSSPEVAGNVVWHMPRRGWHWLLF